MLSFDMMEKQRTVKYKADAPNLRQLFLDRIKEPIEENGYEVGGYDSRTLNGQEDQNCSIILQARRDGKLIQGSIYNTEDGEILFLRGNDDTEGMRKVASILERRLGVKLEEILNPRVLEMPSPEIAKEIK